MQMAIDLQSVDNDDINLNTSRGEKVNGYYDPNTNEIILSSDLQGTRAYETIALHEWVHRLRAKNSKAYKIVADKVLEIISKNDILRENFDFNKYAKDYDELNSTDIFEEIVADFIGSEYTVETIAEMFSNVPKSPLGKVKNALQNTIDEFANKLGFELKAMAKINKAMQMAIDLQSEVSGDNTNTTSNRVRNSVKRNENTNSDIRFSKGVDVNGKTYIIIDNDILEGVSRKDWLKTIKQEFKKMQSINMDFFNILVNKDSMNEYLYSKYSQLLKKHNFNRFKVKLKLINNLTEIVQNAYSVTNEDSKHTHKKYGSFNRAEIDVQIGSKDYHISVVTAISNDDNSEIFYDIVDIEPTKIDKSLRTETTFISQTDTCDLSTVIL